MVVAQNEVKIMTENTEERSHILGVYCFLFCLIMKTVLVLEFLLV